MKIKNVLITGGNGFIGSHITNKFVDLGYKVFVICRRNTSDNPIFNKNVKLGKIEILQGNIKDFDYSQITNNT